MNRKLTEKEVEFPAGTAGADGESYRSSERGG